MEGVHGYYRGNRMKQGSRQATHNLQHGYVVACDVASKDLVKPDRGRAVTGKAPLPTAAYQQRQQSQGRQQTLWDRNLHREKPYVMHRNAKVVTSSTPVIEG